MLGLTPAPQGATVAAPNVYGAPVTGALLASLGMLAFGLLALMPTTFDGVSLLRTLMALALAGGGIFGILFGYVSVSTRIEIAPEGAFVTTPGWRACPYPPVRQYRLDWADVRAVRHRTELYRIRPLPLRLPLEAYAIETTDGFILFGGYYLSDLEPVLIELAHRADRPWCEDGEVEAGLLGTLLHGAPPWPTVDQRPAA
jgi:hypothetical protein